MDPITNISIALAIGSFITIFIIGTQTNILRETKEQTSPYSFSRFQLWLWALVIIPAFALNWGFNELNMPAINLTSLILLGIPAGVALSAGIINSTQKDLKKRKTGFKLKEEQHSQSFLKDILMDDNGQFSVVRLQQLLFTVVYVVIYTTTFFIDFMGYPDFDNSAYVLMGISAGTYLIGKGSNK